MTNNGWIEVVKKALRNAVPLLLGIFVNKNNAKENADDLVKKAKKAIDSAGDDAKPK